MTIVVGVVTLGEAEEQDDNTVVPKMEFRLLTFLQAVRIPWDRGSDNIVDRSSRRRLDMIVIRLDGASDDDDDDDDGSIGTAVNATMGVSLK